MSKRKEAPARTIAGRENQLIDLAVDLVEKRLIEGTATSQEVTHFLKLGSTNAILEKERMIAENKLILAKAEALETNKNIEKLFSDAVSAMSDYKGSTSNDDDYEMYD